MKEPTPHLKFILDTLETIKDKTPNDHQVFMTDSNAQDATLMRLQDIGEQLSRIRENFPDFYEKHQTDEWHKLIGLRNLISHGYREIDFGIIWDVVENKLGDFTNQIIKLAD